MSQQLTLSVMQIIKHTKGAMIQFEREIQIPLKESFLQKIKISKDLPYLSFDDALLCLDQRFFDPIITKVKTTQYFLIAPPRLFSFVWKSSHSSHFHSKMEF